MDLLKYTEKIFWRRRGVGGGETGCCPDRSTVLICMLLKRECISSKSVKMYPPFLSYSPFFLLVNCRKGQRLLHLKLHWRRMWRQTRRGSYWNPFRCLRYLSKMISRWRRIVTEGMGLRIIIQSLSSYLSWARGWVRHRITLVFANTTCPSFDEVWCIWEVTEHGLQSGLEFGWVRVSS